MQRDLTHLEPIIKECLRYCPKTGAIIWIKQKGKRVTPGMAAGTLDISGYIKIGLNKHNLRAHRIAWFLHYGAWPVNQVDHIDGDRANNRINNLRDVTQSDNQHNIYDSNIGNKSTGLRGVTKKKGRRFQAKITVHGVIKHLGSFDTAQRASYAYQDAKLKYVS